MLVYTRYWARKAMQGYMAQHTIKNLNLTQRLLEQLLLMPLPPALVHNCSKKIQFRKKKFLLNRFPKALHELQTVSPISKISMKQLYAKSAKAVHTKKQHF